MMHRPIAPERQAEANYIVYLLDGDGHFRGAEWIAADHDADALARVRALRLSVECELWQQARRVARVAPSPQG